MEWHNTTSRKLSPGRIKITKRMTKFSWKRFGQRKVGDTLAELGLVMMMKQKQAAWWMNIDIYPVLCQTQWARSGRSRCVPVVATARYVYFGTWVLTAEGRVKIFSTHQIFPPLSFFSWTYHQLPRKIYQKAFFTGLYSISMLSFHGTIAKSTSTSKTISQSTS